MPIDVHCHFLGDDLDVIAVLEELDLKMLNVAVPEDNGGAWREPLDLYARLARDYPDRYAWCTGMDLPDWDDPDWADRAIDALRRDVANGAVGVKIWKNIGMELRRPDGTFLQVDDPVFIPVFEWLAREGITVLAHLGEPIECWSPTPTGYYRDHPEWWMYAKPDYPTHADITAARDRVVARHPALRFVGAHMASLEFDLKEIARRFDQWPNFAIEIGGRFGALAAAGGDDVRAFFAKYGDRIMFGTDYGLNRPASGLNAGTCREVCRGLQVVYPKLYSFHATAMTGEHWGEQLQGLSLPAADLEQYYEISPRKWFPGI